MSFFKYSTSTRSFKEIQMGTVVHAKKKGNTILYRLWSENSSHYVTKEMTQDDMRKVLLAQADVDFDTEFKQRIERANKSGTSSFIAPIRSMEKWD